jgi:hypothetical protein
VKILEKPLYMNNSPSKEYRHRKKYDRKLKGLLRIDSNIIKEDTQLVERKKVKK